MLNRVFFSDRFLTTFLRVFSRARLPSPLFSLYSDEAKMDAQEAEELKKKRQFRKFSYRGVDLEQLLTMNLQQITQLLPCRARRVIKRGSKHKKTGLMKKLRNAKKNCAPLEKPEAVKTHLRNAIILPEMVGCIIGIHNGKVFNQVEIKPEMIGHYLGEFSMTYKPVKHGRPGIGATHSSRFIPLK
ncbi:40S ribosomal protein S15-like [Paramacrobiotus metropolitanus]|uniref:40S ribosomal protein S15-like n=1 Tax=Paramacrobiotus metropolitanus TaxID=2943436 RepID=UPI002446285D|nr:40S ribosomal protein S15-like [Paramacrobiotus metropolitanus]